MNWLYRLASLKLTLIGMLLLTIGSMLSYGRRLDVGMWVLVVPLAVLAVNLLAAIATNRRINRQPGVLVFHLGLLGLVVLIGIGRLTYLEAQIEIVEGTPFDPAQLQKVRSGPLHPVDFADVSFIQGAYTVNYAPDLRRRDTFSEALVKQSDGTMLRVIFGDDKPLVLGSYRFYTSFNKGFSPVLTWIPDNGQPVTGSVNMPSYPMYDYKQGNAWTTPQGVEIKFWLQLQTALDKGSDWVLEKASSSGVLVVDAGDRRVELRPGDEVALPGGALRFEELRMWMGYTIFYDPTLRWLFFISVFGILGLGWHLWQLSSKQAWAERFEGQHGAKQLKETEQETSNGR